MGPILATYTMFLLSLFVFSSTATSLKTALWGFGLLHLGCALFILTIWWKEERQEAEKNRQNEITQTKPASPLLSQPRHPTALPKAS